MIDSPGWWTLVLFVFIGLTGAAFAFMAMASAMYIHFSKGRKPNLVVVFILLGAILAGLFAASVICVNSTFHWTA